MKTLIVYYSFTGNNEALARKLREQLDCDIIRIQTLKKRTNVSILLDLVFKRTPKLQHYDIPFEAYAHFIIIAPVWAGRIGTPIQTFLKKEKRKILRYSFITVCSGVGGQKKKIREFLESALLHKPAAVEELWVNDLLQPEQKDKIKFTTPYRLKDEDWKIFNSKIEAFLKEIKVSIPEEGHLGLY